MIFKSYTPSKKQAWRSCPFESAHQNHYIMRYATYILNTTTQQTYFDPNFINLSPYSIIIGDFNSHSHLWDHVQPPNARGDKITDWIINKDLHILNDGSDTRTSRITGNDSTPDLSLCGDNWSTNTSWILVEFIDNSDHVPISIAMNHRIRYQSVIRRKARWRRNGVD